MCISEYTKIPVSVCSCRRGPQRKHCMCVRVYVAVKWDCSIYAVMCHTWLRIHVSFPPPPTSSRPCTANMCDARTSVRACDRQASAEVQRLMTAARPLMTPSILSTPAHTDYPQRHLLTLYANEQREGVMRKEWQIKKKEKREERLKRETEGKASETVHERACERTRDMKQSAWTSVTERKIREREQKNKTKRGARVWTYTVWEMKNEYSR